MKIEELNMSTRTTNALILNKINTVEELQNVTEDELIHFRKFGRKSLEELIIKMENMNLQFREV